MVSITPLATRDTSLAQCSVQNAAYKEFDELLFQYGLELDEDVSYLIKSRPSSHMTNTTSNTDDDRPRSPRERTPSAQN